MALQGTAAGVLAAVFVATAAVAQGSGNLHLIPPLGLSNPPSVVHACPTEKPHRIEIPSLTMTCNAIGCLGRLRCGNPDGSGERCWRDTSECANPCKQDMLVYCISDEELAAARK